MRRRVLAAATAGCCAVAGGLAPPAAAHGLAGRADLPIPEWLFAWGAAVVLLASFVALAVLWPRPRLEDGGWRPLPAGIGRALASRPVEIACGAIGVALLGLVLWSGVAGEQVPSDNLAPTFVYVVFWVGLVPVSALLGDVFRAFNPWRAIGRLVGWAAGRLARQPLPPAQDYPERLGRWPAVVGLLLFAWLELAAQDGDLPRNVSIAAFAYSGVTFVGMALYGANAWIDRAETFSVYFNLFSRLSPLERRGGEIGLRRPLSGLAALEPAPGTVALLAAMIGTVTFDGLSEGEVWAQVGPPVARALEDAGVAAGRAVEASFTLGIAVAVVTCLLLYRAGVAGARSAGGSHDGRGLGRAFAHSLVPIALVYVLAHYVTLLVFQGQAIVYLASDPLGTGADLLGTAGRAIDYGVLGATATWYLQVGLVVAGHVAALALAHDRALVLFGDSRRATRSQYPLLAAMVGFTTLALWLLAQANA